MSDWPQERALIVVALMRYFVKASEAELIDYLLLQVMRNLLLAEKTKELH